MTIIKQNSDVVSEQEPIRLLLIDDEANKWAGVIDQGMRPYGFKLAIETNPDRASSAIGEHRPHVILLDLHFPGDGYGDGQTTGGALLKEIRQNFPGIPVVVFTTRLADDDIPLEVFEYPPHGSFDKVQISEMQAAHGNWEPILAQALNQAIEVADAAWRSPESDMGFVVGATKAMHDVTVEVRRATRHPLPVLIYGETGTGKRSVAETIHHLSGRNGQFVPLNCSSMHEETLFSLLFGHGVGTSTGAEGEKPGLLELADKGTLFLNEIQAIPPALQNNLMAVIEKSSVRRMGSDKDIPVNVSLIFGTNELIDELFADEILRGDLFYLLREFEIKLPPLRERMEDLPVLCQHLIGKANEKLNKHVTKKVRPEVLEILQTYNWPGNIRELQAVIRRAVAITQSNVLLPTDIEITRIKTNKQNTNVEAGTDNQPDGAIPIENAMETQAAKIAEKIDGMALQSRYSFITGNFDGELRRLVLIEVVRLLRNRQSKKVQHKQLANYLDVVNEDKDYERIRQMVVTAGIKLTKIECNQ
ncbi:MAG: sigma 54-interacting transcriptional regulator [Nitrosomonas sp.]